MRELEGLVEEVLEEYGGSKNEMGGGGGGGGGDMAMGSERGGGGLGAEPAVDEDGQTGEVGQQSITAVDVGGGGGTDLDDQKDRQRNSQNQPDAEPTKQTAIEDDIEAELRELRGERPGTHLSSRDSNKSMPQGSGSGKTKLGLVMLDIPCVSFLRLPAPPTLDTAVVAASTNAVGGTADTTADATAGANDAQPTNPSKHMTETRDTEQSPPVPLSKSSIPGLISESAPKADPLKPYDPTSLVYHLCRTAYQNPTRQKSRFIQRLTPVFKVRKILSGTSSGTGAGTGGLGGLGGLEKLCLEVLPATFGPNGGEYGNPNGREDGSENVRTGWKYAIRVTVRNNNQLTREEIIKVVAGFVVKIGRGEGESGSGIGRDGKNKVEDEAEDVNDEEADERRNTNSEDEGGDQAKADEVKAGGQGDMGSKRIEELNGEASTVTTTSVATTMSSAIVPIEHKVDLKNYEKLILVDVYRNVVGMSVVGEAREHEDQLRRFNLAEIYAEGRKRSDTEKE